MSSTPVAEVAMESPAKKRAVESVPMVTLNNGCDHKANGIKNDEATNTTTPTPVLKVELMNEDAKLPLKGSTKAAGFDLFSAVDVKIPARGKEIVSTGIKVMLPENCYGRIAPRSGLAAKHSIDVGAGVVDEDYRGELMVVMFNFSDVEFAVTKGMRIAQLICERIWYPDIEKVDSVDNTDRGEGGLGSTGTH